jgi:hypothetical protein
LLRLAFGLGAIDVYFALIEFAELDDRDGSGFLAVVQSDVSVSYTVLMAAVMLGLARPASGYFNSRGGMTAAPRSSERASKCGTG